MADLDFTVGIIGAVTGAIALFVSFRMIRVDEGQLKTLQDLVRSLNKVVMTYDSEVKSLWEEIRILESGKTGKYVDEASRKREIERQKLEQKKRDEEFQKIREKSGSLGWLLDFKALSDVRDEN